VYWIVTLSPSADDGQYFGEGSVNARGPRGSGSILPEASIPKSLSDAVDTHSGALKEYTLVKTDDGNPPRPALAVASG